MVAEILAAGSIMGDDEVRDIPSVVGTGTPPADATWLFRGFRLSTPRRALLHNGIPIRLGGRAFDILVMLVEKAGTIVSNEALIARVWPDTFVDETSLRVHISALRRVLNREDDGVPFISNTPGLGYSFVVETTLLVGSDGGSDYDSPPMRIMRRVSRPVGRAQVVEALAAILPSKRLITIVGPGGVGKTTVAVSVAQSCAEKYHDGSYFLDLEVLSDQAFVATTLASALGISLSNDNPVNELVTSIGDRAMLIIFDNCEHVVTAVAMLAEAIHCGAPNVSIIATSREPLHSRAEYVHQLEGLAFPAPEPVLTAATAICFSAIELFVDRARATRDDFQFSDSAAALAADLCRRLDGMPLAIELAAARMDTLSLADLVGRLNDRFALLTLGRRTAASRQQTLRATLDWSYGLLSASEQVALTRLAIFRGAFSIEEAVACCATSTAEAAMVSEAVAGLAIKSLLSVDASSETTLFRLLETTRAYAGERLTDSPDIAPLRRRYAVLLHDIFGRAGIESLRLIPAAWLELHERLIDDMRSAIGWAFGSDGDPVLAINLVHVFGPVGFYLQLFDEVRTWYRKSLDLLPIAGVEPVVELEVTLDLSLLLMWTTDARMDIAELHTAGIALSERIDSDAHRIEALAHVFIGQMISTNYPACIGIAVQIKSIADRVGTARAELVADRLTALAHHFSGHHLLALAYVDNALEAPFGLVQVGDRLSLTPIGSIIMSIAKARSLFLIGKFDEAVRIVDEALKRALVINHPLFVCDVLTNAKLTMAFWSGDYPLVRQVLDRLQGQTTRISMTYYQAWRAALDVALERCEAQTAGRSLEVWPDDGVIVEVDLLGTFHESFVSSEALQRAESGAPDWCTAELVRARGEMRRRAGGEDAIVEAAFQKALAIARSQGALYWELRAALSLARLWTTGGAAQRGRDLLAPIYARFTDRGATQDLRDAGALLGEAV